MNGARMPVLFLGHGTPMNGIEENAYTRRLRALAQELPRPKGILVISAHWLSAGTWITRMEHPRTIHDFGGFPEALYQVQYPAPGSRVIADEVRALVDDPIIQADENAWGLDHGTWTILRHMYPEADIPVLQLSIDMAEPGPFHYELGKKLQPLRDHGYLIVGSGNITHNLRRLDFAGGVNAPVMDWAREFDEWVKKLILDKNHGPLMTDFQATRAGQWSVPTPDHYLPLLYVLGAGGQDTVRFEYESMEYGSLSMRSVSLGRNSV